MKRNNGKRRTKHRKIDGQYVPHIVELIESPAWQVLSLSAHRVLDRIEIEHLHHGGRENGRLAVRFADFVRYGVHRHAIAPALREVDALGLVEVTQRGHAGNAEFRSPNYFRLTYLPTAHKAATHEWRRIITIEAAGALCRAGRAPECRTHQRKPTLAMVR
jgi:hypothetical protein